MPFYQAKEKGSEIDYEEARSLRNEWICIGSLLTAIFHALIMYSTLRSDFQFIITP